MTTTTIGRDVTGDIIDAELVGKAAMFREAAGRKARAGALATRRAARSRGASLARRLGRGLRNSPRDFKRYWNDSFGVEEFQAIEPGKDRTAAREVHDKKVVKNRAVTVGVVLSSLAWCTAGWTALHRVVPGVRGWAVVGVVWLLTVALAVVTSLIVGKGKHKHGWLWPSALWVVVGVAVLALFVHLALPVAAQWLTAGWLAVAFVKVVLAGADGNLFRDEATAAHSPVVATDTRYNRIVEGFATELKIKVDADQIKVIGAGLEPVDTIWSRMRLQFPGTIRNQAIKDAVPGVASFIGISTERLDVIGIDDASGGEIEGVVEVWLASSDPLKESRRWPLLDVERTSVWEQMPLLTTDRGTTVTAGLLFAMWMWISKTRHGKTWGMRLAAYVFALDPTADYAAFDFKPGGRDWFWTRRTAVAGAFGNSDESVLALRDFLKSVIDGATTAGQLFQALPESLVPNGQLTKQACEHEPRLRPLGIFIDEAHHALMHPKYGKEVTALLAKVMRELPFLAVVVTVASQLADVRNSIPAEVRNLIANRVAGKLYTSRASGDVLGDAANELGYNAKNLRPRQGLFIVHGVDDTASFDGYTKGVAFPVNNVQAGEIGERAHKLRLAAGVLDDAPTAADDDRILAGRVAELIKVEGCTVPQGRVMPAREVASRLEVDQMLLRTALARLAVLPQKVSRPDDAKTHGHMHYILSDLPAARAM